MNGKEYIGYSYTDVDDNPPIRYYIVGFWPDKYERFHLKWIFENKEEETSWSVSDFVSRVAAGKIRDLKKESFIPKNNVMTDTSYVGYSYVDIRDSSPVVYYIVELQRSFIYSYYLLRWRYNSNEKSTLMSVGSFEDLIKSERVKDLKRQKYKPDCCVRNQC